MPSLSTANLARPSSALLERADRPVLQLPQAWPNTDATSTGWPSTGVEESSVFQSPKIPAENGPVMTMTPAPAPDDEPPSDEPNYLLWGGLIAGAVVLLGTGTYFALKKK